MNVLFLNEMVKHASQVLNTGKMYQDSGLCLHFHILMFNLPDYSKTKDYRYEHYCYSVFYFYRMKYGKSSLLGPPGVLNEERIDYLNWIINEFPNMQQDYQKYREGKHEST